MIKALARLSDETQLIMIGLSHLNVRLLRKDKPIIFPLRSIDVRDDRDVVISYVHPDGRVWFPAADERDFVGLAFCERALRLMCRRPYERLYRDFQWCVFRRETQEQLLEEIQSLICPDTLVEEDPP